VLFYRKGNGGTIPKLMVKNRPKLQEETGETICSIKEGVEGCRFARKTGEERGRKKSAKPSLSSTS